MASVPASREYEGGFATRLMSKDLGLAQAAAKHCNASVPMSMQAAKLYQQVLHSSICWGPAKVCFMLAFVNHVWYLLIERRLLALRNTCHLLLYISNSTAAGYFHAL